MKLDPKLNSILWKVAQVIGSTLLLAFSGFLSKVLEPVIAWFTFTSMKLLIKLTKSETLRSLYGDMKKGYKQDKS
jgi:hypothetical protein